MYLQWLYQGSNVVMATWKCIQALKTSTHIYPHIHSQINVYVGKIAEDPISTVFMWIQYMIIRVWLFI